MQNIEQTITASEINDVLLSEGFTKIPSTECAYERNSELVGSSFTASIIHNRLHVFHNSTKILCSYRIFNATEILPVLHRLADYYLSFTEPFA